VEKHEKDRTSKKEALSGWLKVLEDREKAAAEVANKQRAEREALYQQQKEKIRK
jgi:hypothetical protein